MLRRKEVITGWTKKDWVFRITEDSFRDVVFPPTSKFTICTNKNLETRIKITIEDI